MTTRRAFLGTLAGSLLAAPFAAEAEQAGKVWRVGFIYAGSKTAAAQVLQPFLEGMRQLGYVEGRNLKVEVWAADGHPESIPTLAEQLVRANPDVIVVISAGHGEIVQKLTKTLPIVTLSAGELASSGLVASLVKPGGNLTGMQLYAPELIGKRLQILKETVPGVHRLAVLRTPIHWGTTNQFALYRQATEDAAMKLGMRTHYVGFDDPEQLPALFTDMAKEQDEAALLWANPNLAEYFDRIHELMLRHRLPAVHELGVYVRRGGLIAYGPNQGDVRRQAASYVDRIFKGAKPGDLPIGQPTTFELVINLKTAKAIGLTIPPSLLARADEVIQ